MNYSLAVFLINTSVRAVTGIYEEGQKPTTFKTFDQDIKKDDICVVPSGTRHGFTTIKIIDTDVDVDFDTPAQMAWVVCKIDLGPHKKILEQEEAAVKVVKSGELRKKREDLAAAILKDQQEQLKTLEISNRNGGSVEEPTTI